MKSAKKSKIMEKSDSDLDEFDDDMSYEEVIIYSSLQISVFSIRFSSFFLNFDLNMIFLFYYVG
jgi:hypothetical protein